MSFDREKNSLKDKLYFHVSIFQIRSFTSKIPDVDLSRFQDN
jgi:hypothetical protein